MMTTLTQLIEHYCPDGVEYVKLEDVAIRQRGIAITAAKMRELDSPDGDIVVFGAGATKALIDSSEIASANIHKKDSVIVKARGHVGFEMCTVPFATKSEMWSYRSDDPRLNIKFGYYFLSEHSGELAEIARLNGVKLPQLKVSDTDDYLIPLPPREVQDAIVERLDAFAALIESLDSEIALREKRFEYFREQLLTFADSAGVEHVKLGDVAESVKSGATPKARTAEYYDNGTIPWLRTNEVKFNTITSTEMMVTEKALAETPIKWIEAPSVVVAISGATAGRSAIIATPVTTNQHCCCLHFDEAKANYRFVFNSLALRYEELKSLGRGARGDLNAGIIKNFQIPLPSLEAQQDIVDKLDIMQSLIDNLKQESELRRTQFEYYREKLLTFNS